MKVPAAGVAVLPETLAGYELHELSVIADAVTTPYQAVLRSGLSEGGFAVIVGAGGVGTYAVQIANAMGARVMALDVDDAKLERILAHGADAVHNVAGQDTKTVRKHVRSKAQELKVADFGWKIFEMSGTTSGQELAYGLLTPAATLSVVGFAPQLLNLRLSNLMALDASAIGNWGCAPRHYPAVIDLVLKGRVNLRPFIQSYPLEQIGDLFEACHRGQLSARAILTPEEA
jgi:6-hydroxycyclohex-1-ene-1-carbonyl-CoA dehydrogenase